MFLLSRIELIVFLFVHDDVFLVRLLGLHPSFHYLGIVGGELFIDFHQRVASVLQSQESILHLFRRDEVVPVHNLLIVGVYLHPDFVQHPVCFQCYGTPARCPSRLGFPYFGVDGLLATELRLCPIDRDASVFQEIVVLLY